MADEPILDPTTQTGEAPTTNEVEPDQKHHSSGKRTGNAPSKVKPVHKASTVVKPKLHRHSDAEKAEKLSLIDSRLASGTTLKAAIEEVGISEQTYYNWKRVAPVPAGNTDAPAVIQDSLADLLALEAENLRLRTLLTQKLRAENAELRKKLSLD